MPEIVGPDRVMHFKGGQLYNDTDETMIVETEDRQDGTFVAIRGFMGKRR